jgi:NAD(P)-dependent dehydrogenase (short-subunit alcohol dehydrogenase family)
MKPLQKAVAVVVGGSRGAGRGIALALGDAGATVYVAARTSRTGPKPAHGVPGTVEDTADEVTARGGKGIPVVADLSREQDAAALFERVRREHGRLDVMANSAWAANFMAVWQQKFWELSASIWEETLATIGVCWWSSVHAARLMTETGSNGLIVHVTDNPPGEDPSGYRGQILHDLGHESLNRLIWAMARECKKAKITVVGMNPGFMRTEGVMMYLNSEARKRQFRYDLSETPEYIGRAVAALAADKRKMSKTGKLLWACNLAKEYGFTDVDGRYIPPFDIHAPFQGYPWEQPSP